MAEGLNGGKQLMGILHAQQTRAPDRSIPSGVQSAVGAEQRLRLITAAAFNHHNRFITRRAARG